MNAQTMPSPLDVLNFPLSGSHLIEASAGTGKTFTIAMLYVRLVLGHGGERAFARPLTPPEILVVTFTDAATKELRDRIRARLTEAAGYFQRSPQEVAPRPANEDLLHDLRAEYPPEQWPGCARKLQLAAEWMDEAAVSTIHGWCNRMLGEHAFDSDSLFSQTLETDQSELLLEVVRDYWRTFFFPLDVEDIAALRNWWSEPDALYRSLTPLLEHVDLLGAVTPPRQVFAQTREEKARELAALKSGWDVWCGELRTLLEGAVAAKVVDGRKLQARYFLPWLEKLQAWANGADETLDIGTGWTRLTPAGLLECWKQGQPPDHPALTAMETLPEKLKNLPDARGGVLRHACRWVAARFQQEQQRRAQMGFNDLLVRLDAALNSENGPRLAQMIRQQFPLAMIDEFQDTDPLQYRIFDAVYRVKENDAQYGLILIGDPKQAIYAFRGADIFTYLRARRDTAGRHYTLTTNFRSTRAMVDAVNQVFSLAESRSLGAGAFLFRRGDGENQVPFMAVRAKGRDERWLVEDAEAGAMTFLCVDEPEPLSKTDYRRRMAAACADEIVRLLRLGQQRQAGFAAPGNDLLPVRPGDMAVLVNTGREAQAVRDELKARGVRSVYLSDKESVFASPQAGELQYWLAACAEPENDRLLRAALGTATLGLSWPQLDRLNHDEQEWESRVEQFHRYQKCWRKQGVLPMLRRLMWDFDVPRRLLSANDSRALTDLLHLSELLQQAGGQLDGDHALIRYLAEQRQDENQSGDARKLRLESDAALVKVVTVHKSKGLEYPLVFLPFACSFRAVSAKDSPLKWHDDQGNLQLSLNGSEAQLQLADRERLGEDLRKFYVALTRARHAIWLGMAWPKGAENSAAGYLLNAGEAMEPAQLADLLLELYGATAEVRRLAPSEAQVYRGEEHTLALAAEPALRDIRGHRWRITSYSGLKIAPQGSYVDADAVAAPEQEVQSAAQETFSEAREVGASLTLPAAGNDLYGFPRGAAPGNFLHGLLEWAGREGFAALAQDRPRVEDQVARRCNRRGWQHWIPTLTDWLLALINQPLPMPTHNDDHAAGAMTLAGLNQSQYQVEMEFWFSLSQVNTQRLDGYVRAATLDGAPRATLLPDELNGMLKGFIDLVFEHQGRYYVLDYKSNWLGAEAADYDEANMARAMLDHRYDLQLTLYLFALHRLLKSRLPDYDYDRHVGGALYLFLRGGQAASRGGCPQRPDKSLIESLERLFSADKAAKV
ncbi:exodeoxyribonuclease V subunit beta [Brenneria corticis]|uniref:RecBCD enzyme subunit RecB n=1 Tax=Brenneria corticis TaxID=2173106 RepID=A0A2U1TX24_9GAMM|nr:exodeoxyribonuclease V subunit beta [Brenneria sp. CFCC 11842]PWC13955.1 exodeoxyribonuclease V subunit beta [Brenneria sp. CFCC 11842]